MVFTLDIQKKAAPIIAQGLRSKSDSFRNLGEDINDLILSVEGFDNHVFELNKAKAKALLDETNKVIAVFVDIDDKVALSDAEDKEVIEKFRYALKALYKLRSLLHLVYTSNVPVNKTPADVKEGVSAISRAAVLRNVLKHSL